MALRLFLALALVATAQARLMHDEGISSPKRSLLVSAICPEGCNKAAGGCVQDATTAGLRCQQCLGNLVVNKATGLCTCPAGKYSNGTYTTCSDCPKGSYCIGGVWTATFANAPMPVSCNPSMTTIGLRSTSNRACVNQPGTYYVLSDDGNATATTCPVNTYGAGLKKQRACVPCPTGYTTDGLTGKSSPTACKVPAGYYLKAPGQVAPCPKGEWKSGVNTNASCTKCAFGVTTPDVGATSEESCSILIPGYYALTMKNGTAIVTQVEICPQKYYCPGGAPGSAFNATDAASLNSSEPTIKLCPDGMWTIDLGSQTLDQCLTPPGFFTSNGTTQQCAASSYRADWKPAGEALSCTSCGAGIYADKTDQIVVYDIVTKAATNLAVQTSADDCYIRPGQGLYYTSTTNTWRARDCNLDNYGVSAKTYGLTPSACRDCPSGMVARNDVVSYPTSASYYVYYNATAANDTSGIGDADGFTSVKACVTMPGYGYNGRIAQKCDTGYYNARDTYSDCTACAYGLTTAGPGLASYVVDCGIAAGFGNYSGAYVPCPIGTYNNESWTANTTASCTPCPDGLTTQAEGADSLERCNLCSPGRGGVSCADHCGGLGAAATYGIPGRAIDTNCSQCTQIETGYSFEWQLGNDLFAPQALARPDASSSVDCVTQFSQMRDGAWYLPTNSRSDGAGTFNASGVSMNYTSQATFADCVAQCVEGCEYVTYDYVTQNCYVRWAPTQIYVGAPLVAFKAVPSGDVGTNAWKVKKDKTKAKAGASGLYSFYQEPDALSIGYQTAAPGASGFTGLQDCLNACDNEPECAGITIVMKVIIANRWKSCKLITGETGLGVFYRSMTRADTDLMALPTLK